MGVDLVESLDIVRRAVDRRAVRRLAAVGLLGGASRRHPTNVCSSVEDIRRRKGITDVDDGSSVEYITVDRNASRHEGHFGLGRYGDFPDLPCGLILDIPPALSVVRLGENRDADYIAAPTHSTSATSSSAANLLPMRP